MAKEKRKPKAKPAEPVAPKPRRKRSEDSDYARYRKSQGELSRVRAAAGQEIGPIPEVANPVRRKRCARSLQAFCETYFPARFPWPFSTAHIAAIERIERCSSVGGRFANAMPRGAGKTTQAECAVLWAVFYGLRRFVVLMQATEPLAAKSLKRIKRELETNDLLLADFPEACFPIRCLERNALRARMQKLDGVPTRLEYTAEGVTLPDVPGSPSAGAIFHVVGITAAFRGLSAVSPAGQIMRPDMVVIDDAQTRATAKSPTQTGDLEVAIADDVLGLAGPDVEIAALMLCTVIYPNDLSDRYLSSERHPEWQGKRTKMLEAFPTRLDLWDQYSEVRNESFTSGDEGERANQFLRENWGAMHDGAVVSWPERMKKGELSAVQSAMNLYYTNPRGFKAEYQNEPDPVGGIGTAKELLPDMVAARLSGLARFEVPREATRLTAMIDCGLYLHWYAVVAWDNAFGGSVIDYGCWPQQARTLFAADDARPKLMEHYRGLSESQAVYRGLEDMTPLVLGRTYFREGNGEALRIEKCLIDCGFQSATVHQFIRQSSHAPTLLASKGVGRTTTARGVAEWKPKQGERSGYHWRLTISETGKSRMVQFDPDMWKSALHERLSMPLGGRGALTLYGRTPSAHEMIAEHCAAETADPAMVRGLTFDKWMHRPHKPDNHLWDALVGAAVCASVQGLAWSATENVAPAQPKQKVKLSDLYAAKNGGRP